MAQRLQAIRDMRAASQSRIAAQGGTPATSAAKPTPKVAPPAVNPNQQSSIQQKVAKVKQPVQPKAQTNQVPTGDTIETKVNPDSSIKVTQKRSPEATAKIKKSLDI